MNRLEELRDRGQEALHGELFLHSGALGAGSPRLEMVRVWVLAAR